MYVARLFLFFIGIFFLTLTPSVSSNTLKAQVVSPPVNLFEIHAFRHVLEEDDFLLILRYILPADGAAGGGDWDGFIPGDAFIDLNAADEFRNVIAQGRNITTDDLLIFELRKASGPENLIGTAFENTNVQAINETDRTTNLVDADSGEVISDDVQVKEVQYTYRSYVAEANNLPDPDEIRTRMFVVYNNPDGNEDTDDVRAYIISVGIQTEGETVQDSPPGETLQRQPVRTVFDSFQLVE
jgi:hypothetical protein